MEWGIDLDYSLKDIYDCGADAVLTYMVWFILMKYRFWHTNLNINSTSQKEPIICSIEKVQQKQHDSKLRCLNG